MIFRLLRQNPTNGTIQRLYGAIVAQARLPSFYLRYGVPDTVDGRFDLIVLHLFLVMQRLRNGQGQLAALVQPLVEAFCRDLDHNLREMGVSDLAVPKRVQASVEALYGRSDAYRAAGDMQALAVAVARNVFGKTEPGNSAALLANYMIQTMEALNRMPSDALVRGDLALPDPETIVAAIHA